MGFGSVLGGPEKAFGFQMGPVLAQVDQAVVILAYWL